MLINSILYILSFVAITYYILYWNKNNKLLRDYITRETKKIRNSWAKYSAGGTFFDGIQQQKSPELEPFANSPIPTTTTATKPTSSANKTNCLAWNLTPDLKTYNMRVDAYNSPDTNEFAPMDKSILKNVDGSNINPQVVANEKRQLYNKVVAEQTRLYIIDLSNYLSQLNSTATISITPAATTIPILNTQPTSSTVAGTNNLSNRELFFKIPAYVNINPAGKNINVVLTGWLNDPAAEPLISANQLADILIKYPNEPWTRIYSQILIYKQKYAAGINIEFEPSAGKILSYNQLSNAEFNRNNITDPISGASYYPADRTYLNSEAIRRYNLIKELDRKTLSNEDFNAKWSWINNTGKPLNLPAGFDINSSADSIKDVQSRSVMDILTDYDPTQFGCQRIYQECSTRTAPGFVLDAYNYDKYDNYLNTIKTEKNGDSADPASIDRTLFV